MKTVFKNKTFYHLLISLIAILMLWNLYLLVKLGNIFALAPISLQFILLMLILTQNRYAKLAILIWASVFIIGGPGLIVLGNSIKIISSGLQGINIYNWMFSLISIMIGITIVVFTKRTVAVKTTNQINDSISRG